MSSVLCLPACLCVRRSMTRAQAPHKTVSKAFYRRSLTRGKATHGNTSKHPTAAEVRSPGVRLGAFKESNQNPDPENLKTIAYRRGGL